MFENSVNKSSLVWKDKTKIIIQSLKNNYIYIYIYKDEIYFFGVIINLF